jgi:hypothetical protein
MKPNKWQARTRQELIIEVWEALDCESVGEPELLSIQAVLAEVLGVGAVVSPARIARELVDEGAVLRHPEVLQCDTKWREEQLVEMFAVGDLNFDSLEAAAASLVEIESVRLSAQKQNDQTKLDRLRNLVSHLQQQVELVSRSKIVSELERSVSKETARWLVVWLEQPELFSDWLNLRQRSPEYQRKFGNANC